MAERGRSVSVPVVALDARLTRQMSVGMKRYVTELARRLPSVAPDLRFLAIASTPIDVHPDMGVVRIAEKTAINASLGEQLALPRLMRSARAALAHFPTPYAPRWPLMPYVYTIHDMIHRRYPAYHSWKIPPYYALVVGPVARRARLVIAPTRATGADVESYLRVSNKRVRPVPLAADQGFFLSDADRARAGEEAKERFGLRRPFFLYAGNHRRHKNLETMADGWQRTGGACDLIITEDGPLGFSPDRYAKEDGRIVQLGHVGERELVGLYAGCVGSVQPSLYEGFGLAVVESMAAGAPCIVAQTPALLEVAADAALTFPPHDADALARALDLLLVDMEEAARLRAAGRRRVSEFSWDKTARATAAVYREALNK